MRVIHKNANFWVDSEGVLIFTDIEKKGQVLTAEAIYDGKNAVVLNRNDSSFYALKNIAPRIRGKIADAKSVTIVEQDKGEIYSYEVVLRMVDDLGIADEWDKYADNMIGVLKEKLSPDDFNQFVRASKEFVEYVENK